MKINQNNKIYFLIIAITLTFFSSCQKRYRQNIMFTTEGSTYDSLSAFVEELNTNYKLSPNDYISLKVYTSNGEMLIDPERQLEYNIPNNRQVEIPKYLVNEDGNIFLPLVGSVSIGGLTLLEADSLLSIKYNDFYENSFVLTKAENRRVTVLGGVNSSVIPIQNENTTLLEILALSGGIDKDSKATNIRLIRGDLSNPSVQIIDLSTIDGMRKASLKVQNNDVIYIEPVRRVVSESIKEISPILSFITSLVTFTIVIVNLRN